ncbi:MAG TPA: hypothetical protein VF796_22950, partial [Humisphaera sp.]
MNRSRPAEPGGRRTLGGMYGIDLPADAVATLHARADRHRDYHQRLLDRLAARGVPPADPLRVHVRAALLALRDLSLQLTDSLPKGQARRYLKRARSWPRV